MIRRHTLLIALGIALVVCVAPVATPRATATPRAALVGTVSPGLDWGDGLQPGHSASFHVIGGYVQGKGWVGSQRAGGLMHKGDCLPVYDYLARVQVADITLTGKERVWTGQEDEDGTAWGLMAEGQVGKVLSPHSGFDYLLAAWHSPNSPVPRWVSAESLSPANPVYRRAVGEWLASRGVSAEVVKGVALDQIVRTDINGDGRHEVFIAFASAGAYYPSSGTLGGERPTKKAFSYLVMRYLPRGSRTPKTVVLSDVSSVRHQVLGFCDLDADGRAEVLSEDTHTDWGETKLHRWVGTRFSTLKGSGGSA